MITEYFYSQGAMNAFISEHSVTRDKVSFMGQISGGRWQLSYWKS